MDRLSHHRERIFRSVGITPGLGQTRMSLPFSQVDAFADRPFTGNPAAVVVLDSFPDDGWMQSVASEMNLSETAFVVASESENEYSLRWFTPAAEVDLCGHATLASAHVLFETWRVGRSDPIHFQTRSGPLTCRHHEGLISMDFPAIDRRDDVTPDVQQAVLECLGLATATVFQSRFDIVVVVEDEASVIDLAPDFHRMKQIATRGVIVTALSSQPQSDFTSRFFAPRHNIDEDPVTGSAHCCLAPYWCRRLGRQQLIGYQASQRGGFVDCELRGDRVRLSGCAVTVFDGQLRKIAEPTNAT
ncbi:PhzF family phenazine biosynthesis protein [Crateriforma spongiae]|uniref:PhzF family phenazine biosynthesis protein n=1 Tax=Crateriforma spongiae TaxID=2724528 RepID=UPI0039AEE35D